MSLTIEIDVRTLYEFSGKPTPVAPPPVAILESMVHEQFSFLPQPMQVQFKGWMGVITYPDTAPAARAEAERLGLKAAKRAAEGSYDKAIGIWKRALELEPSNCTLRRDLAMALVEKGVIEEAKNHLIEVLRMHPDDVWGLVVLGNLYNKHEHDLAAAERFIQHALAVKSDDPWATNSLAAIRMEQGRVAEAIDIFSKCIAAKPSFANPYLGMAMAQNARGGGRMMQGARLRVSSPRQRSRTPALCPFSTKPAGFTRR